MNNKVWFVDRDDLLRSVVSGILNRVSINCTHANTIEELLNGIDSSPDLLIIEYDDQLFENNPLLVNKLFIKEFPILSIVKNSKCNKVKFGEVLQRSRLHVELLPSVINSVKM
jgi:DNA-binding NtrC family response regulator